MKAAEYADYLTRRLEGSFDLEYGKTIDNMFFDITGKYFSRSARYMVSKNLEIYAQQNNEYVLFKKYDRAVDEDDIDGLYHFLKRNVDDLIDLNEEHMESVVILLVSCRFPVEESTRRRIEKFKFYKSYKFGFNGWVNGKIIVVDPTNGKYISNKFGRRVEKNYTLFEPDKRL